MKNLAEIRKLAGISQKDMSNLLNKTVYMYNAYETGRFNMPTVLIKMIALMYEVDEAILTDDSLTIDYETEQRLAAVAALSEKERYAYLYSHILEENQVPNYRNIERAKARIEKLLK